MLQVCVNGARRPAEHPRLTTDPALLAAEACRAVAAGASCVHIHPKSLDGSDSLDAGAVAAVVQAVRSACPGVPVGVTTGAWAQADPVARVDGIRSWTVLPDFASVNWHEDGADDVARVLLERGVGVEAGVWHADGLARWLGSPLRDRCLRVLVELPDLSDAGAVEAAARPLLAAARAACPQLPVLLHGEESSTWPAIDLATRLGLDTRVGLEDTLALPGGEPARDNAHLVSAALSRRI